MLIECNENTGHGLYQLASGRGVLNADFLLIFDKITARNARNARIPNAFESKRKACQKANAHFQLPKVYLKLRPYLFPNTSTAVRGCETPGRGQPQPRRRPPMIAPPQPSAIDQP